MADWIAPLVPLLPILAALWIAIGYVAGWNRGERGERHTMLVCLSASALALAGMLVLVGGALLNGQPGHVHLGNWFSSGAYQAPFSFTLDTLGLTMGTLVAVIAWLTQRFSFNYMHREAGFQRYYMVLSLFNGAMLLIVLAGNAALGVREQNIGTDPQQQQSGLETDGLLLSDVDSFCRRDGGTAIGHW